MIEVHGRAAAAETFLSLARLPYRYVLPSTNSTYPTADDLLASLPDACVQVIGYP